MTRAASRRTETRRLWRLREDLRRARRAGPSGLATSIFPSPPAYVPLRSIHPKHLLSRTSSIALQPRPPRSHVARISTALDLSSQRRPSPLRPRRAPLNPDSRSLLQPSSSSSQSHRLRRRTARRPPPSPLPPRSCSLHLCRPSPEPSRPARPPYRKQQEEER